MSNMGLIEAMKKAGIRTEITTVGDRYVIERMRDLDLNLGGEQSGHLIFRDYATTGDGIISALHVLRLMKRKGQSLHELASGFMTEYPQRITSIPVQEKIPLENLPEVSDVIHKAETELAETGRVMVRYSGTENKCRVLVEAKESDKADFWSKSICAVIRKTLS